MRWNTAGPLKRNEVAFSVCAYMKGSIIKQKKKQSKDCV